MKHTQGIHHITAIVGHPQENYDFYARVLGLRLVKKTVNFDDPKTYHLYFGDEKARPGSIITFFPWPDAEKGRIGGGQVGVTSYAVPENSLGFWESRLTDKAVPFKKAERFGEETLQFEDPHGLLLELVERKGGPLNSWSNDGIDSTAAIKGFAGTILYSTAPHDTIGTLVHSMGLKQIDEDDDYVRLKATGDIANIIDVKKSSEPLGVMGVGTVHHIAWRAHDEADHKDWQEHMTREGYGVTDIKDRNYFKALYLREKGNILFEIASDTPGFAVDEPEDSLGEALMLPEQYETKRSELEANLIPLNTDK